MSWAKLDDRFHAHPKVLRAMQIDPAAIAMHALALSYTASYELDGAVPSHFPATIGMTGERVDGLPDVLVDVGLWRANGDGWEINDFTEYNPSRAELEKRRQARARAGRKAGRASGRARKTNDR